MGDRLIAASGTGATNRFDGFIAGVGTASGLRAVVGHWVRSPLGPFTDVMVEHPGGHRTLLAPTREVADFVAATYRFDEVRLTGVVTIVDGRRWQVAAEPLDLAFEVGPRPPLGLLLRAVPRPVATSAAWIGAIDAVARRLLPGVRTRGSAGGGRSEFYGALDLHRIRTASVSWDGADQGPLAPVHPPVRFGFGSTPRAPSLVRIVTLIRR